MYLQMQIYTIFPINHQCMWPIVVIARSCYFQNIESATPSRTSTPTAIVPSGVRMCKLWGLKIKEVAF